MPCNDNVERAVSIDNSVLNMRPNKGHHILADVV